LIGYPLTGSLSPHLHAAALEAMGLRGDYRLYPISPSPQEDAQLAELVDQVRTGRIQGLNVTIPHKQTVLAQLDGLTDSAEMIGAVNTIFREQNRAVGDNTDAPGFLRDLERLLGTKFPENQRPLPDAVPGMALVLGAGGAARAVVCALWRSGWQVAVAARRPAQAQEIVSDFLGIASTPLQESRRLEAIPLD